MNKFLFIFFISFFSISLLANSQKKDVVKFATVNANYRLGLERLAAKYEKIHPNVKVQITVIPNEFETWIRTRVAGGGDMIPDIYNVNFTRGYDEQGKLLALNEYLNAVNPYTGKPWKDSMDMNMIERYSLAGKYYQIPYDYVEIAVFYNKNIFKKLNLNIPETWDEWLNTCKKIQNAGYVPIAIGGDANSFWAGDMGWLVRMLCDAYIRDLVPLVVSKPGDWDYDPEQNAGYHYNPSNLYSDLLVTMNNERIINAILDGTIDFTSPKFKHMYIRLKQLSEFFQTGYMGVSSGSSRQLFYKQRAAMCLLSSAAVSGILNDFQKMDPSERFDFGNFWFPPITNDSLCCGPFRGVGGGGMSLAILKKNNPRHETNVVDFLRFISTPNAGKLLVESTIEDKQPLIGPLLIKGVKLPEDLADKYKVFMNRGFEKLAFRGLLDEQESVNDWVVIAQEYMGNRLSLEEFGKEYNKLMKKAARRLIKKFGYDLDPKTKDTMPLVNKSKNFLNPFENGSLMLAIIIFSFLCFAAYNINKAKGPKKNITKIAFILLFPTVFLLATFNYFPALSGLYHAFTKWEEGQSAVFNGLDNFKMLIHDRAFFIGIGNMIILLTASLFKAIVIPFIAAELILALTGDKLQRFFRTSFLVPMVVPGLVGILIWRFIYDPNGGLLNQALTAMGLEQLTSNWLGDPKLALTSIVFMGFPWIGAFGLLIYMAGLMNIPKDIYESFSMESTNIFKRIWHIDIPLVRGQIRMLTILTFIGSVQNFQTVLLMTRGGPGTATYLPALRMYYVAFSYSHFGYGAAIGLILFLIILLITIINLKVIKPTEEM